ncbi:MAG: hypothetical protein MK110_07710 [Fuerstiella sp.]|nr:hypothetical protein [Fuerstiella sp.]
MSVLSGFVLFVVFGDFVDDYLVDEVTTLTIWGQFLFWIIVMWWIVTYFSPLKPRE